MTSDSDLTWDENGAPRSRLFDDVYFSSDDGLAESRAVFLEGCHLPQAWSGRRRFCVAELGFGTGLNILALLDLWRRTRPPGGHLHVFSVEAHPFSADDATRALSRWPEIDDVARLLLSRWPGRARGFHRVDMPELGASLDVAIMDVARALQTWSGPADAWFLDGFAPSRNPEMWRPEVLELVAARSAPGARIASFTVAGQVRRDLAEAGLEVERMPGFGRKRHRLEARVSGPPTPDPPPRRVAIIGAGIAGASLCRAFTALGADVQVIEAEAPGAGASGGPVALVAPRLDAGLADHAALFAQGFARAVRLYADTPAAVLSRGAVQHRVGPKDAARFSAIAGSDLFEPGCMLQTDIGLEIQAATVIEPSAVFTAWLNPTVRARVADVTWDHDRWTLLDPEGAEITRADVVCLAAGMDCARIAPGLPLTPVRGQASLAPGAHVPGATLFGAYVIPAREGVLFGATHDRDDTDARPRDGDHIRHLDAVAVVIPELAKTLATYSLRPWTGIRATTRDYLPLAGEVAAGGPGLFVLGGLGSRGFTLAPLLAEHIASVALSAPSPLPRPLAELVDPARFERRARRRGRPDQAPTSASG